MLSSDSERAEVCVFIYYLNRLVYYEDAAAGTLGFSSGWFFTWKTGKCHRPADTAPPSVTTVELIKDNGSKFICSF